MNDTTSTLYIVVVTKNYFDMIGTLQSKVTVLSPCSTPHLAKQALQAFMGHRGEHIKLTPDDSIAEFPIRLGEMWWAQLYVGQLNDATTVAKEIKDGGLS